MAIPSISLAQYSILLDQSRIIQTTACPTPVGEARSRKSGKWIRLPCQRWTCESCGPHKVKRLKIRTALGDLIPEWFLTLTLHTNDQKPIMDAFNLFVTGLRKDGYSLRYFCAREFTRAGKRHLHLIGEGWIPYRELSKRWQRATGCSKWTNVRPCHNKGEAVHYVVKYMTKAADSRLFEKGERRYSASRGVLWPAWKSSEEWDVFIYRQNRGKVHEKIKTDYGSWARCSFNEFVKSIGRPTEPDQQALILLPVI